MRFTTAFTLGLGLCIALTACGDDDEQGGTGGTSGKAGSGGKSSSGGSAGSGATSTGGSSSGGGGNGASGGSAGSSGGGSGGSSAGSGGEAGADGSATGGSAGQAGGGPDGSAGADGGLPVEFAGAVPLSETEHDRFWSVTFDAQGRVYAAGFVAAARGTAKDTRMAVARFKTDGTLDTSFGGGDGIATHDVAVGTVAANSTTVETARSVVVQSDGKVVLAGIVEHDPAGVDAAAQDADVALVRFDANGTLDSGFATGGVRVLDLGAGAGGVRDVLWDMQKDTQNRLVLFASKKADVRADRDRVVVRLSANGQDDPGFTTHTLDVDGLNLGDNSRNGIIQPDGKIVAAGYTSIATDINEIVLVRLNTDGTPDNSFDTDGVLRAAPYAAPGMSEAYGAGRQSDGQYVTTGYGRAEAAPAPVDLVSARFSATGVRDTSWGESGLFSLDIYGDNDRGRNLLVLPDDRVLMVGTGMPVAAIEDAMVVMLSKDGDPDTSFAPKGYKLYEFGRSDEEFYGVALSPDGKLAAAAGYRAGGSEDEDATLLILPLGD